MSDTVIMSRPLKAPQETLQYLKYREALQPHCTPLQNPTKESLKTRHAVARAIVASIGGLAVVGDERSHQVGGAL